MVVLLLFLGFDGASSMAACCASTGEATVGASVVFLTASLRREGPELVGPGRSCLK